MPDLATRRSWRRLLRWHVSLSALMVLVLILGCGLGWVIRGRLKDAETAYRDARVTRQVAETAVVEYEHGIYAQELETAQGEIALAEAELKRGKDRLVWSDRMFAERGMSTAQHIADKVSLQQKIFAFEQAKTTVLQKYTGPKTLKALRTEVQKARSNERAKKAVYDRVKTTGFALSW